jgi:hypothetical protein
LAYNLLTDGTNVADGTIVIDGDGSKWQYNSKLNIWSRIGVFDAVPVVTETSDGLMPPAVFARLNAITTQVKNGLNFDYLKIYPHTSGYYYLFQSTNHTITFEPESESDLRIEVNRSRLLALLAQLRCPGAQGITGPQGATGINGAAGADEHRYAAKIDSTSLIVDAIVLSTIGTPISFRLFKGNSNKSSLTILQSINGDQYTIEHADFDISSDSFLNYDRATSRLSGVLISNWSGRWYYKASEIGRTGMQGPDGSGFFTVVKNDLIDSTVAATKAIISLRYNSLKSNIYYYSDTLFKKSCVSKLAILRNCVLSNVSTISNISDLSFAAVQATINTCKNITRYQYKEDTKIATTAPTLQFAEWTPVGACWTQHTYNQFDWESYTQSSVVKWRQANSSKNVDSRYPWTIIEPQYPGQRCCQEDFFFCSNVNDVTGSCPVLVVEPIVVSEPGGGGGGRARQCCPCDCPSHLDTSIEIDLTPDLTIKKCIPFDCVANGSVRYYDTTVNIPKTTTDTVKVTITFSSKFNTICDEAKLINKYTCRYPSTCNVLWSVKCSDSGVIGGLQHSTIGSDISFTYSGQSDVSLLFMMVINTTGVNCCLGYTISPCVGAPTTTTTTPAPTTPSPSTTTTTLPPLGSSTTTTTTTTPAPFPSYPATLPTTRRKGNPPETTPEPTTPAPTTAAPSPCDDCLDDLTVEDDQSELLPLYEAWMATPTNAAYTAYLAANNTANNRSAIFELGASAPCGKYTVQYVDGITVFSSPKLYGRYAPGGGIFRVQTGSSTADKSNTVSDLPADRTKYTSIAQAEQNEVCPSVTFETLGGDYLCFWISNSYPDYECVAVSFSFCITKVEVAVYKVECVKTSVDNTIASTIATGYYHNADWLDGCPFAQGFGKSADLEGENEQNERLTHIVKSKYTERQVKLLGITYNITYEVSLEYIDSTLLSKLKIFVDPYATLYVGCRLYDWTDYYGQFHQFCDQVAAFDTFAAANAWRGTNPGHWTYYWVVRVTTAGDTIGQSLREAVSELEADGYEYIGPSLWTIP